MGSPPHHLKGPSLPASLEARRRAVVDALRRVAAETPPVAIAVERRLDELSERLRAVETVVLEAAWARPAGPSAEEGSSVEPADEGTEDERVPVPAVPLGEGRMSSVASHALFGH